MGVKKSKTSPLCLGIEALAGQWGKATKEEKGGLRGWRGRAAEGGRCSWNKVHPWCRTVARGSRWSGKSCCPGKTRAAGDMAGSGKRGGSPGKSEEIRRHRAAEHQRPPTQGIQRVFSAGRGSSLSHHLKARGWPVNYPGRRASTPYPKVPHPSTSLRVRNTNMNRLRTSVLIHPYFQGQVGSFWFSLSSNDCASGRLLNV